MPDQNNTELVTTVGVEIEMENTRNVNSDVRFISDKLSRAGLNWVVKTDASCGRSGAGVELNSPILRTDADLNSVSRVCEMMDELGYKVTKKCGLHVHIDVRRLTEDERNRLIRFFVQYQDCFFELAPGRRAVHYCAPLTADVLAKLRQNRGWSAWSTRYFWMNGCAYTEHGTVEFRLMSGSLNPNHVTGWVNFLLYVYDKVVNHGAFGDATFFHPDASTGRDCFDKMLHVTGLDNLEVEGRAEVARSWVTARWDDAHSDVQSIRAERRRRLQAAWRGEAPYVKIVSPNTTMAD